MESNFPDAIDDRLFLSETSIDQKSIASQYNTLLQNEEYSAAIQLLKNNNVAFVGQDVMELIEDQIVKIEEYINELPTINNHKFSHKVPDDIQLHDSWISSLENLDDEYISTQSNSELSTGNDVGRIE